MGGHTHHIDTTTKLDNHSCITNYILTQIELLPVSLLKALHALLVNCLNPKSRLPLLYNHYCIVVVAHIKLLINSI
ncbi:hypothetical protein PAHAL_2G385600 [Panicum hallii]|uniref:Uncharacterized protein n=1 Tax=Panicum hallii TaxID=206008 RepID=A0A2S3H164_9POAL|nr:hypothetical protein PAHAL_2G385600 [Panicum hallii]